MPFSLPAVGVLLDRTNFADPLKTFVDNVEASANNALAQAQAAASAAAAKYTKPAGGIPLSDLASAAVSGLVQNGGGVTHAVVMTQAAYDALTTKSASTLYVISG